MVRTSSRIASCVLAASLLGGCHVTIQSGSTPAEASPPPAETSPPPPPPAKTASRTRTPAKPDPEPARRRQSRWRLPASNAPRITAPNAFGNGEGGAFRGLAYVIPEGSKKLPSFEGLVPFAMLFTDRFEVKSQEFSSGFPGALMQNDWFAIRFEGEFQVPKDGKYQFRLTSDDGAILYVNDKRVVANDGVHSAKTEDGEAELTEGTHRLRLDYFQAQRGQVALMVQIGQKDKLEPLVGVR
ncbi:PA14 domain-containing protein [Sorangium sp. So ce1024]|uniref:PA14 domain-containing protein n=1 Tax=Sorangium sp. So ce1024 TaxID=3133327 RepID=UPI003EFEB703